MTTRTSSRLSYRASCGPSLPLVSLPLVLLMLTAACSPTSDDAAPAAVDSGGGGDGAMDRHSLEVQGPSRSFPTIPIPAPIANCDA